MEGLSRRPAFDQLEQQHLLAQLQAEMFGASVSVEFGRYVLGDRLGAGAMGVVYVAQDPRLDRQVALKVLHPDRHLSDARRGHMRLRAEARAISRVSHPNVIEIYDVGEADGRVFIAMELVRGQSLEEWLSAGERNWRAILDVFVQAGEGLAAAHEAGVVHRDFKPSNVQVGEDGRVRVLDFGLARSATLWSTTSVDVRVGSPQDPTMTADGALVGTPRYMAPAQLRGAAGDPAADQYAFCVALHEALFGEPPFDLDAMLASKERADAAQPKDSRLVPAGTKAALRRGLCADADDRFDSMADLLAGLRSGDRARWPAAVLAGAALLGVGVAVWGGGGADPASSVPAGVSGAEAALGPADREVLRGAEAELERSNALSKAEDYERALQAAEGAFTAAVSIDYRPLQARAGHARGTVLSQLDRGDEAVAALEQAHLDAVVSELDTLRVKIALKLSRLAAEHSRYAEGDRWMRDVEARIDALNDEPELMRRYYQSKLVLAREGGRQLEAIEWSRKSVALSREFPGENNSGLISALQALGIVLFDHQELDESSAVLHELIEIGEASGGVHDRTIANVLMVLAGIETTRANVDDGPPEQYDRAVATARKSAAAMSKLVGPDHYDTANARLTLGIVLSDAKLLDEARVELEFAKAQFEALRGASDPGIAVAAGALGMAYRFEERYEEAAKNFHRAVVVMESTQGANFPELATYLTHLAMTEIDLGRYDEAQANLDRAKTLETNVSPARRASTEVLYGALEKARNNHASAAVHYDAGADLWAEALGESNWRTDANRKRAADSRAAAKKAGE